EPSFSPIIPFALYLTLFSSSPHRSDRSPSPPMFHQPSLGSSPTTSFSSHLPVTTTTIIPSIGEPIYHYHTHFNHHHHPVYENYG
ncbi:hypothetical protein M8C21_025614, partial [Ambrosia artemisiifolia]